MSRPIIPTLSNDERAALEKGFCHGTSYGFRTRLSKPTAIVLDNALIHHGKAMRQRRDVWQEHGLFVFSLPAYLPRLPLMKPEHRQDRVAQTQG